VGLITLAGLAVIGGGSWMLLAGGNKARPDLITHKVHFDQLQITIVERGALESAENRDVVCRVKARSQNSTVSTIIRWVIDDGTQVNRGDKLVELDDSGLQEQLKNQKITLETSEGNKVQAEEAYKITVGQNESDIKAAEVDLALSKIDLRKYQEGDFPQALKDIEGRISSAQSDVEMQRDRSAWAQRMVKKGYYTVSQAQAEQSKLESYELVLRRYMEEKRVLTDPEYGLKKRTETDLTSKVALRERELARIHAQALAKEVQARTDRDTKKSLYLQALAQYEDIEAEIKKCKIYAPQAGLVVYYVPEQTRFGSGAQQSIVAQGEPVREGQKLMRIPDLSQMLVNTRVHEAMVSRVRGETWKRTGFSEGVQAGMLLMPGGGSRLLNQSAFASMRETFGERHKDLEQRMTRNGQRALVRIDAFPGHTLEGHVKTVATVASQQDWLSADVKVYQTMVSIDEELKDLKPGEGLKPGMSAEVTIFTDSHRDHVLTVPIQAILGSVDMGSKRRCYVMTPNGAEAREIVVGLSNDKMAEVDSGLQEGDEVVVNPRVLLSDKDKAQYEGSGKRGPKGGKGKDGKGMGGKGKDGNGMDGKSWPKDGGAKGGWPKGEPPPGK
jgi:multidrug efflux pump subunit AcrA (membrane-fusion protein)